APAGGGGEREERAEEGAARAEHRCLVRSGHGERSSRAKATIAGMARAGRKDDGGIRVVATNRKARHEYELLETFEAGIALVGTEVKSLREGRGDLSGAFAVLEGDEVFLKGMEIGEYVFGNRQNHEPRRRRKLLLHRR